MNKIRIIFLLLVTTTFTYAQLPSQSQIQGRLPKGTIIYGNIPYNNDTLKKHLLDIYLPADAKVNYFFAPNEHSLGQRKPLSVI